MNYLLYYTKDFDKIHEIINIALTAQLILTIIILLFIFTHVFDKYIWINNIKNKILFFCRDKMDISFTLTWLYILIFISLIGWKIIIPSTEKGYELYFQNHFHIHLNDPNYQLKYQQFKDSIKYNNALEE